MRTDRRRMRGLLLAVFVPVLIVIGVLASAVLGQTGSARDAPTPLPTPEAGIAPTSAPAPAPEPVPDPASEPEPASGTRFVPDAAERIDVGTGAQAAAIFRPAGSGAAPGPVVVFLHGWVAIDPARYGRWIGHLVGKGATVIFPAYQTKPAYDTAAPLNNVLAGVRAALAQVRFEPGRLVVVGHSAGGALAADYAAVAADHGLPAPAAVLSVYPGRKLRHLKVPIPAVDLMQIAPGTRLIAMAGERDTAVGSGTARRIVAAAARADARLVIIRDDAVDRHRAPRTSSAAAQRTFWEPLDALIADTQAASGGAAMP